MARGTGNWRYALAALSACVWPATAMPAAAAASKLPEIRTSDANQVPACVTPGRLMSFLQTRNARLEPRFHEIARWYKHWGEAWRVRWDYAFFQMAIETNFLTYRRPNGRMGDVDPAQNNFAGIGTTGGGVPGDSFPDVKTGVLAQIQHLVAYSGERLAAPVAPRTRLKQDDIVEVSLGLERSVRFSDLSRRWAADPKYGTSIEWVAKLYRSRYCTGNDVAAVETPAKAPAEAKPPKKKAQPEKTLVLKAAPLPADRPQRKPKTSPRVPHDTAGAIAKGHASVAALIGSAHEGLPRDGADAAAPAKTDRPCTIAAASYGGRKTVLIRADAAEATYLTALTVVDGFEASMTESFIRTRMPGGEKVGDFDDKAAALETARAMCRAS